MSDTPEAPITTERETVAVETQFELRRPPSLWQGFLYLFSIPERIVRSVAGWVGGLARFVSGVLPRPIRESRFYRVIVDKQLEMLIEDVGGARVYRRREQTEASTIGRKIVGGAIDNVALITLRASPIWLLLAFADVVKGGAKFTAELVDELREAGVIDPDAKINNVEQLLGALSDLSGEMADTLDTPPLDLDEMKASLAKLRKHAGDVDVGKLAPTVEDLNRLLDEMNTVAEEQGRSLWEISTGMALHFADQAEGLVTGTAVGLWKGIEVGARMAYREVVVDYFDGLESIRKQGLYRFMYRTWRPYWKATHGNFDTRRVTWTEIALTFGKIKDAPWRVR